MSDPRNNGTWCVGVVSEPEIREVKGGRLIDLRVALDRAKRSSVNPDETTAFFNVTVWDDGTQSTKFAFDQVEAGNLKKGSQIMISGAIGEQEFENKEGQVVSRWGITAHGLTYQRGGGERKSDDSTEGSTSGEQSSGNVVRDF